MSSTTILQLRQQESSDVLQNGVFQATLDHPIQLEEGDIVQVKAVYLDTVADVIELTEDEEITMSALIYVQNYNLDQQHIYDVGGAGNLRKYQNDATLRTVGNKGDNQLWFLSSAHENTVDTNWSLPFMEVVPINTSSDSKRFGDITLEFQYTPITPGAKPITDSVHITSKVDRRWADKENNPREFGFSCTGTTAGPTITLLTTKADLTTAGIAEINWEKYQVAIPNGEIQIEPQRFPISFILPRGTYTPSEIAQTITNEVSKLQYTGKVSTTYGGDAATYPIPPTQTNWPSMNPWLQTVLKNTADLHLQGGAKQIFVNADNRYGGTKGGGAIYFEYDVTRMAADYVQAILPPSTPVTAYRPPLDKFLGTNQFAMEFDLQENKIKMTQMHFPLFVNDTTGATIVENGLQGISFNEPIKGEPGDANACFEPAGGIASAYSGICFSTLSPGWFWDAMGFGNITVNPVKNVKMNYPDFSSTAPTTSNSYTLQVDAGVNTTSAFEGLDLPVIHSNAYPFPGAVATQFGRYSVPRQDPQDGNDVFVSTADVASIFSSRTLNDNLADEGYFLVEVSSNFRQNLIGGNLGGLTTSRDTQSIVNRYYTSGSFTSDQGAGSIVYEHTGEPQMLSNFGVKVRNPNGSFVSDTVLKEKNAIFLEVIKQNKTATKQ